MIEILTNFYDFNVKTIDQKKHKKIYKKIKEDRQILIVRFGDTPDKLRREYLDMCEAVQSEVIHITRF